MRTQFVKEQKLNTPTRKNWEQITLNSNLQDISIKRFNNKHSYLDK